MKEHFHCSYWIHHRIDVRPLSLGVSTDESSDGRHCIYGVLSDRDSCLGSRYDCKLMSSEYQVCLLQLIETHLLCNVETSMPHISMSAKQAEGVGAQGESEYTQQGRCHSNFETFSSAL